MNYSYIGSGGAITGGCARTSRSAYIKYKWGEGSIVYVYAKAIKGIVEAVCIKQVLLNSGPKTYNQVIPIYKDTYNYLWNESDLITEADARYYALAYWEQRNAEILAWQCKHPTWP